MTVQGTETGDVGLEGETLLFQSEAFVAIALPYLPFSVIRRNTVEWGYEDPFSIDR